MQRTDNQSPQLQFSFQESQVKKPKENLPKKGEKEQLPKETKEFCLEQRTEQTSNSTEIWKQRIRGKNPKQITKRSALWT